MTTAVDLWVIEHLNAFSRVSFTFDKTVYVIAQTDLLKGGVLMAILWWCWTRRDGRLIGEDLYAVRTVVGALLAILVGRAMQNYLPMRLRPGHEPTLDFVLPHTVDMAGVDGWSSFPSDHAVLFFGLSFAIWKASRWLGLAAFLWTLLVICLPRVYLGFHYATDIIVGGLVGVAVVAFAMWVRLPGWLHRGLAWLQASQPGVVYALAFLGTYQMATVFANARRIVEGVSVVLLGS
ncbi:phosphatase PAP2 family protein [Azospirillum sp. SYSU D00513]|uniref:phosphatase PAP2 family protein n=1 Tax=Azospirillum sp. SYSU D00513 TaxID=2812561 RepID=UPI001A974F36|nr:phosphatase PAP2 family protein [Azospirillum sp. SYSU D00513]